jgi:hypothetical protein
VLRKIVMSNRTGDGPGKIVFLLDRAQVRPRFDGANAGKCAQTFQGGEHAIVRSRADGADTVTPSDTDASGAAGQGIAAQLVKFYDADSAATYFGAIGAGTVVLGLVLLACSPLIRRQTAAADRASARLEAEVEGSTVPVVHGGHS